MASHTALLLLLLTLCLPPPTTSTPFNTSLHSSHRQQGTFLTLDPCNVQSDCRKPRRCLEETFSVPCQNKGLCICAPPRYTTCASSAQCESGELCVRMPHKPTVCVSRMRYERVREESDTDYMLAVEVGDPLYHVCFPRRTAARKETPTPEPTQTAEPTETPEPMQTPLISPSPVAEHHTNATVFTGFTGSPCLSGGCRTGRACISLAGTQVRCCGRKSRAGTCVCLPKSISHCSSTADCPGGEVCAKSAAHPAMCVSPPHIDFVGRNATLKEAPEKIVDAACVEVGILEQWGGDMVFAERQRAWVLCDALQSCATGGHMVVWKGRAMMMSTYCQHVACERRVMWVNSPRWRRGLAVPSRTNGLAFTAFAARWGTRTEEIFLKGFVRAGL